MLKKTQIGWVAGKLSEKCLLTISGSKRTQPHTHSVRIHSLSKWNFFFFLLGNRMICVPTGMPGDAACLKEGEEMQSELRGTCG